MKNFVAMLFIGVLAVLLLYVVTLLPPMGNKDNPTNLNVIPRYLEHGEREAGTENIVTGILLNYRGYDTMGEVTVIFSALVAVLAVVSRGKKKALYAYVDRSNVKSSVIVRVAVRFLVPFIILFSIYTILHGDVLPGGGFQGGAVIGASLIIFTIVFGLRESTRRIPARLRIPLEGSAVMTFFVIGILGIIGGANFLTYILPQVSAQIQPAVRTWMLLIMEVGIGVGGAMIFISILFALLREEEANGMECTR